MSQQYKDEEAIFKAAVKLGTAAERDAYIGQACGDDPALVARLTSLLKAHSAEHAFLDALMPQYDVSIDGPAVSEGPGSIIGRYKLLERIGEGGMAVVYMAEQTEPIRRKVALKIIKLGMDTRQVIARFEAERQALALMDHPNIAKVLDAGATETGRPYFVMELVQGVSITEYCDKNNLSTKDRLALFVQVCNAVQHAHQKGIIHRDIKPSNVMVTHHNGKPVPKVIDFGIAKATNQKLTEKTLFTRYAHIIGTPAYMSPEQAELSDLDIDTRTDIYSLGVLLYELLTGTTPFSEEELRKAGYIEMQRIIREQEPAKPSTRLTTLGETLTDIAKRRACTPDLLRKAIRGDLDWIVMKSLEKDRARRYEAAEDLALDIQRHLEHRPVSARAPSPPYRLQKFLRRYRLRVVGGLTLALLVGTLAIVFSMWNQNRLRLIRTQAISDGDALLQARAQFARAEYGAVLEIIEPVLGSRYVGADARLLYDQAENRIREGIGHYTREIEADPQNATAYSSRALSYAYAHDRAKATADMRRWSALVSRRALADLWFAELRDIRRVINLPFDCQLVFSAERPVNEIPVMSVAFGQKGRCEMKLFETPMFVMPLLGFSLLSSLDTPAAYADFTFGEPVNLQSIIPVIDPAHDFIDCFSSDGLEMYLEGDRAGGYGYDLWVSRRASTDDDWGPVENVGPVINSSGYEEDAAIAADGLTLYFESNRPGGYGNFDIYRTTRATKNDPWGAPVNLGPKVNSSAGEAGTWISASGLELYFMSGPARGGYGSHDIYVAKRLTLSDPWADAVNLGPIVNSPYSETCPTLSPDGLLLLFSDHPATGAPRPGGYGGSDIWMSRRASLSCPWQSPVNLGPRVNSSADDLGPRFSPDGRTFSFWSNRGGANGIWQVPIIGIVDFNGDGKVDGKEVLAMAEHWGQNKSLYDIGLTPIGDGVVDANDLTVLAGYIGQEVNDPTLIAHWALDETEGMTAHDSAGKNDAMLLGGATWQPVGGKIGGAVALDGKDDFVRSGSVVLDPAKGPLSVIAWVKGGAPNKVIVSQASGADWLHLNQYGMLTTGLSDGSRSAKSLTSDAFVTDDQWHRVVLTWDGTNRTLQMDGVEVAMDTQPNLAASSGSLHIGAGKNLGATTYWSGLIDDVRVYNRVVQP